MMLSPGNAALQRALNTALGVLFRLEAAGTTVTDIDIRGGTPVLRIDRAPHFVRGVTRMVRPLGAIRETVHAAPYHGAQLEWIERKPSQVHA